MAYSKTEALEAECSKLRKELILAMDTGNTAKEQAKAVEELRAEKALLVQKDDQLQMANQKIAFAGSDTVQTFQLIEEYNIVLFSWYFKGFELLRRYLTKHNPKVDLENLDFQAVDKEIEIDEAAKATTAVVEGNAPKAEDEAPQSAT